MIERMQRRVGPELLSFRSQIKDWIICPDKCSCPKQSAKNHPKNLEAEIMVPNNAYLAQGVEEFNSSRHSIRCDGVYAFPFNETGKVHVEVLTTQSGIRICRSAIILPGDASDKRWAKKLILSLPFRRRSPKKEAYNRKAKALIVDLPRASMKVRLEFCPGRVPARERNFHQQVKSRRA